MCRCVRYVITRITLRGNSCRLPERKCGQQEPRRSCRVLLPVNLCAKLQVPGAYKRQQASVVTSSFYTNSHTHTGHLRMCVTLWVCMYAVYTKIAKLKVRQAFLIGTPKSMLRFSAFFVREREQPERRNVMYTQRGAPAVRFTMGQSAVEHFMLLFFGFMFPTSISQLLFLQLCQNKTHASIKP